MWFSPYISKGDLDHKLKKVTEFLEKKHPVKLTIRVRGRVTNEVVSSQMDKILALIKDKYESKGYPKKEGRNFAVTVYPLKSPAKKQSKK